MTKPSPVLRINGQNDVNGLSIILMGQFRAHSTGRPQMSLTVAPKSNAPRQQKREEQEIVNRREQKLQQRQENKQQQIIGTFLFLI